MPECVPGSMRSGIFEAEFRKIELAFSNAMYQFDARKGDRGIPESFEAEHDIGSGLDGAMVLLKQIVEII